MGQTTGDIGECEVDVMFGLAKRLVRWNRDGVGFGPLAVGSMVRFHTHTHTPLLDRGQEYIYINATNHIVWWVSLVHIYVRHGSGFCKM